MYLQSILRHVLSTTLAFACLAVSACDSDSEPSDNTHPLSGEWILQQFAGEDYPVDETVDSGYSIYRTEQEGLLTIYDDGQGFLDVSHRMTWDNDPFPNETLIVYNVRAVETGENFRLRLTHYDAVVFLDCQQNGNTLDCIDNDAPDPDPLDPEAGDPSLYQFRQQ